MASAIDTCVGAKKLKLFYFVVGSKQQIATSLNESLVQYLQFTSIERPQFTFNVGKILLRQQYRRILT